MVICPTQYCRRQTFAIICNSVLHQLTLIPLRNDIYNEFNVREVCENSTCTGNFDVGNNYFHLFGCDLGNKIHLTRVWPPLAAPRLPVVLFHLRLWPVFN